MSRTLLLGFVLVLSTVACAQSESADRSADRDSEHGIDQCFIQAAENCLDLRSLSHDLARANGPEVRVWLFEPDTTHYFLELHTDNGQAAGNLRVLRLSYSESGTVAHGGGSAWCDLVGSYITYEALAREAKPRNWRELLDKAEVVLREQSSLAQSSSYDGPFVVVEARDASGYRKVVIADFESDRSEAVRAAQDLRNVVLGGA